MRRSSDVPAVRLRFYPLLGVLLLLAVLHTLWATSLDSFTIDEPYHIAAGASYLRFHDFRVNPEHPPLVKLVVALAEPRSVLRLDAPGIVDDKRAERIYTQTAVFLKSDGRQVQRHARFALIVFNTLLLGWLTLVLARVFSPAVGLMTLLLLTLDPTVSAHMPVVMTDLPMALLGTILCGLTVLALRGQRWRDWLLWGFAAGLLLATKHSAPLVLLPLIMGVAATLLWQRFRQGQTKVLRNAGRAAVALLLGYATLWAAYGFRYHESTVRDAQGQYVETFNRSLDNKIADLHTPFLRATLRRMEHAHVAPRAYLWGLADTLRAGVEGRPTYIRAFSHDFYDKAPMWVPFADLIVKLPVAFVLLVLGGVALLCARRMEQATARTLLVFVAMFVFFMAFIAKNGVYYAGLRHWLFDVPLLAVVAAAGAVTMLRDRRLLVRAVPVLLVIAIAINVLPQRRIWEFHNFLAGGSANAWKSFSNESVDLGQRSHEALAFYRAHITPERTLYQYPTMRQEREAEGFKPWEPGPEDVGDGHIAAWFFFDSNGLTYENWKGLEAFRDAVPVTRFGNILVFHGSYYLPLVAAGTLGGQGIRMIDENRDIPKAEQYLRRALVFAPRDGEMGWVYLGNLAIGRHQRDEAFKDFRAASECDIQSPIERAEIRHEVELLERNPIEKVEPLRFGKE